MIEGQSTETTNYVDTIDPTGAAHFEQPLPTDATVTVEMRRQVGAVFIVETDGARQEYILRYGENDLPNGTAIPWHPNEHQRVRMNNGKSERYWA